jgi:hypothetical protein
MNEKTVSALKKLGAEKFLGQEFGVALFDPSCCGGVIQIELFVIEKLRRLSELELVYDKDFKNYGIPIFIDSLILADLPDRWEIDLVSTDPIKFSFENSDFRH